MSDTTPTPSRGTTPPTDPRGDSLTSATENAFLGSSDPFVTDLEQEVLDEYARLLGNVNKLSSKLSDLAGSPTTITLDGLRQLERKTATVHTLLKASVYSLLLQEQFVKEGEGQGQDEMGEVQHDAGTMDIDGGGYAEGEMSYQEGY
ncbi:DASH complex subunit Dad3-domain-containing protein [Aspergillus unguis]